MDDIYNKLDKIETKIDGLDNRLDGIAVEQAGMSKDLKYHIKRTDILEDNLKPIYDKYQELMGVVKFLAALVACIGAIETAVHIILPWFFH